MAALSGDKKKDAAALLLLAEGHLADDVPKLAKETAEQALGFSEEVKDPTGVADALRAVVLAQAAAGEVEAGLAKARAQLSKYKGSDKHGEAVMLLAISEAQLLNQEPEDALAGAKEAKAAFGAAKEKIWQAKAVLAEASAQVQLEAKKEAVAAIEEARSLFQQAGDKRGEGSACEQLAVAALSPPENFAEVVTALESAIGIYRDAGAKRELGVALSSLAEFQLARGKAPLALSTAREALEVSKEAKHAAGTSCAMALVARGYIESGFAEEGIQKMRDEAMECKTAGNLEGEAAALAALFQAKVVAEDFEGALQTARRALGAFAGAKDPKGSARMLSSIARLEYNRGYWEMAIRAAKEALTVLAEAGGSLKEATSLEAIVACAHDARGEEPPSSATREKALKALKELGAALEAQNVEAFEIALKKYNRQTAITDKDTDRAFQPAMEKDPEKTQEFLAQHMSDYQPAGSTEQPYLEREPDCALRTFPCKPGFESCIVDDTMEWSQTEGRMTIWFRLRDGPHEGVPGGWRQEDLSVEMTRQAIKVTLGGKPYKPLTGDFTDQVWRKHSWWILHEETGVFELHLIKRELATWKSPWWAYDNITGTACAKFKRIPYPWNKAMSEGGQYQHPGHALWAEWGKRIPMSDLQKETDMEAKLPGKPQVEQDEGPSYQRSSFAEVFQHKAENFFVSADQLTLGISVHQDETATSIQVHFERFRWDDLRARAPVESLLAVDVWEREICIFLQGDKQNPILWGELGGFCVPHATTWRLTTTETMRQRQYVLGCSAPVLEVNLARAGREQWDKVFTTCVQHRLMIRDAADKSENAERWEGLKDVPHLRRSGFDIDGADFWSYVDDYVSDTMKRAGHSTLPKKLVLA